MAAISPLDRRADHADLTEQTYRFLRELIVTRAVGPGAKLTAEGLSHQLGVSRTTVKGALDQLAAEGLVIVRPQVGTFVRGLDGKDVAALWDARLMVEVFAVRLGVVAATDAQRAELAELVAAMEPTVVGQDYREDAYAEVVRINRRLHELVVETSANPYLLEIYRQLSAQLRIVNFRTHQGFRRADLAHAEHRQIAEAYERRDPALAADAMARHLERSRNGAIAAAARQGGPL